MAESFGVQDRGKFYDETSAIRDVFQNHMLQLLASLTMDPPINEECDAVSTSLPAAAACCHVHFTSGRWRRCRPWKRGRPRHLAFERLRSSSLHLRSEAGYRNVSRTRNGAVAQNGTAASNSFSRMPGSWSGINDPTGYEVGRKCPWL